MKVRLHKKFKKSLKKQPRKIQLKFKEKFFIFEDNQFHYSLNNHALTGKLQGWRSINITGDIRVHYVEIGNEIVLMDIGSHAELY